MSLDLPGFAEPVADAQACFRAVLDAMARPGRIHRAGSELTPPAPLAQAAAAVLLTLADADTQLWLDAPMPETREWIGFHCGAPFVESTMDATFALARTMPDLSLLNPGTHECPETSTTLILQLLALGSGAAFRLSGPGLAAPVLLHADGLPDDFGARWAANHALFPRGADLILCAGDRLAALPRSVTVEEA